MKYKYLIISLLAMICSCKSNVQSQKQNAKVYKFATYKNEPIFEDEFLFEKEEKECLIIEVDGVKMYHCDWNGNGKYKEIGIDYLGIKSKLDNKPTVVKLDSTISIKWNGANYVYNSKESVLHEQGEISSKLSSLNLITELTPIYLDNGDQFIPEISKDSTVIYFWATWCRPCVETLKSVNVEELEKNQISFIPIAYNCSGSKEFLEENNLNFKNLVVSEKSASDYNIHSLPERYTFLKDGQISGKNVNLRYYYH